MQVSIKSWLDLSSVHVEDQNKMQKWKKKVTTQSTLILELKDNTNSLGL